MEGGRLVGQGTYGCVFQPPLLCKSKKQVTNASRVGKITVPDDAAIELKISNRLKKMPLAKNYFLLYDPEACELLEKSQQTDTNLEKCRFLKRSEEEERVAFTNNRQLFAPFGGFLSFYRYMLSDSLTPKNFDYLVFMQHILEGGATLLVAGVSHFDLHPNNLLIDENGVVRFLDFGNAFIANEVNKEHIDSQWKILRFGIEKDAPVDVITNMEAPEITVWNANRNGIPYDKGVEYEVTYKRIFRDMEIYLGISKATSQKELLSFYETNEAVKQQNEVLLFKHYWPGFDAWGIGCIFLDVLKRLLAYPEFIEGVWNEKQTVILATLRGLLQTNPNRRMDCIEALSTFDPNSDWVRRFGQQWLVKKQQAWRKI